MAYTPLIAEQSLTQEQTIIVKSAAARTIQAQCLQSDGATAYDLTNKTVRCEVRRTDGWVHMDEGAATIDAAAEGKVTFNIPENILIQDDDSTHKTHYSVVFYVEDGGVDVARFPSENKGAINIYASGDAPHPLGVVKQKAADAERYANEAKISETESEAAELAAKASATSASTSETNAAASETNAATSATNAATSATNAAASETSAAASASTATTKANEASASAAAASNSESNAATSESNASTSEANAAASASTASTKANEAATSASSALASKGAAATSETNAAESEVAAATSATEAANLADATGIANIYNTFAAALDDLGNLVDGDMVDVLFDETRTLNHTRYKKESGSLVYKATLTTGPFALDWGLISQGVDSTYDFGSIV